MICQKRYSLIIKCVIILSVLFSVPCQSQTIDAIEDLFPLCNIGMSGANSYMTNRKWQYQRNIPAKTGWEYVMWGFPNTNNKYYSETILIGFKKGERNIVIYCHSKEKLHRQVISHDLYRHGYHLQARDKFEDSDISMYENGYKLITVLTKDKVRKGIHFTIYTYSILKKSQFNALDLSQL